jgi:hypothetical protein
VRDVFKDNSRLKEVTVTRRILVDNTTDDLLVFDPVSGERLDVDLSQYSGLVNLGGIVTLTLARTKTLKSGEIVPDSEGEHITAYDYVKVSKKLNRPTRFRVIGSLDRKRYSEEVRRHLQSQDYESAKSYTHPRLQMAIAAGGSDLDAFAAMTRVQQHHLNTVQRNRLNAFYLPDIKPENLALAVDARDSSLVILGQILHRSYS